MPKVSDIMTRLANSFVTKKKPVIEYPAVTKRRKEERTSEGSSRYSDGTSNSNDKDTSVRKDSSASSVSSIATVSKPSEFKISSIELIKTQDGRPAIKISPYSASDEINGIQRFLNSGLSVDRVTNRVMFTFDNKEHMRQGVLQLLNNPHQNQQFINHDQFKNVLQFLQIEKPQLVTPNVNAASPSKDEQEKLQRFSEKFGPAFEDRNKMRLKSHNSPSAVDQQNEINKLNSDPQLNTGNAASKVSFKQFEEKFGKQFQERKARRAQDLFTDKETSAEENKKIDHTNNEPQHRGPRK